MTDLDDIIQGDTTTYNLTFEDADEQPYDITGWTIFFTVKCDVEDSDADAVIKEDVDTHIDPTNGKTEIELSPSQTEVDSGLYFYDIQVKTDTGRVQTVLIGRVYVDDDVTNRTSI